jgi:2-polyprenyl-6-methoxyphenol hydroxylase-like FAD-dependent oxidoreductase
MNVSMQDSHNLAWKLAYAIFDLTPTPSALLLQTYISECHPAASKAVFNKRRNQSDMSREQKLAEGKDQILGTRCEYHGSILVGGKAEDVGSHPVSSTD